MGYYSYFNLELDISKIPAKKRNGFFRYLKDELELDGYFCEIQHYCEAEPEKIPDVVEMYVDAKWYEAENDIITMAEDYPEVSGNLHVDGEEREDIWEMEFSDGITKTRRMECHWGDWIEH